MNLWKNFWRFVVLGLAVTLVLSVYSNLGDLFKALDAFDWRLVPVVLLLTVFNQLLRFIKWEYLLNKIDVDLSLSNSFQIFGSGLIMVMTPGKMGEVWKSWLIRDTEGSSVSKTMSVVLTERLTDLFGISAWAMLGIIAFDRSPLVLIALLGIVLTGVAVLQNESLCLTVLGKLNRVPLLEKMSGQMERLYRSSKHLLRLRPLTVTSWLSVFSWGMECLGFWIVLRGFGADIGFLAASFVFASASILGVISLIPGGLGVTEGSMTGLLLVFGANRATAVGSTLLIRAATLWFSTAMALLIYIYYQRNQAPDPGGSGG